MRRCYNCRRKQTHLLKNHFTNTCLCFRYKLVRQNNGQQLPQDLSLPPVLVSYKNKTDPVNSTNRRITIWLTEMELCLPPAQPTQHKQSHNEVCMNGDLSITGNPSITRQYTNDHLLESHSPGVSQYTGTNAHTLNCTVDKHAQTHTVQTQAYTKIHTFTKKMHINTEPIQSVGAQTVEVIRDL